MTEPTIAIARHAGVCYGVERALSLALEASEQAEGPVSTLGPLIHNPLVVKDLDERGVTAVGSVDNAVSGTLIIRAHGVTPQVIEEAQSRGLSVIDATCPYVKKVHLAAERLVSEGYQLIVVGESGHPEVEGIMGHAGENAHVVSGVQDLAELELAKKVGLVVQTTQTAQALAEIVAELVPRVIELRVMNTICRATQERQESAAELATRADVMIVIGGKNSGNTRRLAQICARACARMHHIEDAVEIQKAWLEGATLMGVTAGASTPADHIERAVERIHELVEA